MAKEEGATPQEAAAAAAVAAADAAKHLVRKWSYPFFAYVSIYIYMYMHMYVHIYIYIYIQFKLSGGDLGVVKPILEPEGLPPFQSEERSVAQLRWVSSNCFKGSYFRSSWARECVGRNQENNTGHLDGVPFSITPSGECISSTNI